MKNKAHIAINRIKQAGQYALSGVVIFVIILSSCTPSRDIYSPQNHSQRRTAAQYSSQEVLPAQTRPDWIFALSKDFMVAVGAGTSISAAQDAAIKDLKVKITKTLGEAVSVYEYQSVSNVITGRFNADAESILFLQHRFQNEFQPVIAFDYDRIKDYYYEQSGAAYTYYIMYATASGEFEELKTKYENQNRRFRQLLDSLTNLEGLDQVEALFQRGEELSYVGLSIRNIRIADSARIVNTIDRIQGILDDLQLEVLSQNKQQVVVQLSSQGRIYETSSQPSVDCPKNILVRSIRKKGSTWVIDLDGIQGGEDIRISFEVNGYEFQRSIHFPIYKPSNTAIKVEDLGLKVTRMNRWNDDISQLQVKLPLSSTVPLDIQEVQIELIAERLPSYTITLKNPGNFTPLLGNPIEQVIDCDLTRRYLLSVRKATVRIQYTQEGKTLSVDFPNVTVFALIP